MRDGSLPQQASRMQSLLLRSGLYGDISSAARLPWSEGRAKMRDDISQHVWHFSPEIAVSAAQRMCEKISDTSKLESCSRNEVDTACAVRRVVVVRPKTEVRHECEQESALQ